MMPDLSRAIVTGSAPRMCAWSTATGVITETVPSATLVESQVPPRPTSMIATSTGASAKTANAIPVITSKNDSGCSCSLSTTSRYGSISAYVSTNRSSLIGSPFSVIRSRTDSRCGLVNRPVRRPASRSRESIIRAVEVLPLVPVRCTTGYDFCGSPSNSTSRWTRSRVGSILCSGQRAWSRADTSA